MKWFTSDNGTIQLRPPRIKTNTFLYVVFGAVVLVMVIAGRPWFTVAPEEEGLVLRFGRYVRSCGPGMHFRLPWPIEVAERERVTEIKRLEIGYRTVPGAARSEYREVPDEQIMLTGDQNIVLVEVAVQFRVSDAFQYRFCVRNPEPTLKNLAEAATRQIVGDYEIDAPLTYGKGEIETETKNKLQELANLYGLGVKIVAVQLQDVSPPDQVASSFREVESARQSFEKYINQAQGYRNSQLAKVEGTVVQMLREAEAKKEQRVLQAKGEVEKFDRILREYELAKDVTRTRLYLETLEKVLPGKRKVIVGAEEGVLKFLDLQELMAAEALTRQQPGVGSPDRSSDAPGPELGK